MATEIATAAIGSSPVPLESTAVTFHEGEVSDDPEKMREFIFAVERNRAVPRPGRGLAAAGPLTLAEVLMYLVVRMSRPLTYEQPECVFREIEERGRTAGDPETLDPTTVEFPPAEKWNHLDARCPQPNDDEPVKRNERRSIKTERSRAALICGKIVFQGNRPKNVGSGTLDRTGLHPTGTA